MGPTWGPPGSCRPQMDPMLTPWTLVSGSGSNLCFPPTDFLQALLVEIVFRQAVVGHNYENSYIIYVLTSGDTQTRDALLQHKIKKQQHTIKTLHIGQLVLLENNIIHKMSISYLYTLEYKHLSCVKRTEHKMQSSMNRIRLTQQYVSTMQYAAINNTLRPKQNRRQFAEDIVKRIFSNEANSCPIKKLLKYVHKFKYVDTVSDYNFAPNRQKASLWPNDDQVHWCIYAPTGLNGLKRSDRIKHNSFGIQYAKIIHTATIYAEY